MSTFPGPRDLDSAGYLEKRDRIFRVMGMSLRVGETAAARSIRNRKSKIA